MQLRSSPSPFADAMGLLALILPWLSPITMGPSPAVAQALISLACLALVMLASVWPSQSAGLPRLTAYAWLGAALVSCVIGLLQYVGATAALGSWVSQAAVGEAYANLRQRNQFASLTNIGLAALLWWTAQERFVPGDGQPHGASVHRAGVAAAVLLGAGNSASSSRTGLVQLVLMVVLVALWGGLHRFALRRVLLGSVLGYAAASFALPQMIGSELGAGGILARLQEQAPACASRLTLWSNVLQLIAQKPWLGWGWGELDYAHFMTLYPGERFCEILDNAHNLPLHLAVELGLPVSLAVCGTGVWLVWRARPWQEKNATRQLAWGVLAMILLHSMLEYPLWYGPFQMAFGLCVWLLGAKPGAAEPASTENRPLARAIQSMFAIFLLAILVFVAWDYQRVSQLYMAPGMRLPAYRDHTLQKVQGSWLFNNQVRFAELTTTPLVPENAARLNAIAHQLLHFSPEARVVEKLIESAVMLGRDDEALFFLVRLKAAYPAEHARWAKANALTQ